MDNKKVINAQNESDIWNQVNADFASGTPANYEVDINHNSHTVQLSIVSSPGGNNEGGYEYTTLKATLPASDEFEFLIQPEDFLNRIGKFFGGQDIVLGYPEFDENVLVKSNNAEKLKNLFSDDSTRKTFVDLSGYSFGTTHDNDATKELELHIQRAVTGNELKHAYDAFAKVLVELSTR